MTDTTQLNILIADDKRDICDTLEANLWLLLEKYDTLSYKIKFSKVFTEHAYDHGCEDINKGFIPDICIFDLVFNGYTGIDLYKYIINTIPMKKIDLCIYTGVEKKFDKRKEAEILASQMQGLVTIVSKPNIDQIKNWFADVICNKYKINKILDDDIDMFDMI